MTIAVYPSQLLPCWSAENYSYESRETIHEITFKSGRARFRRIAKNTPILFNVSALFNNNQLALFESWIYYTLNDIAKFNTILLTSNGLKLWTVRLKSTAFKRSFISHNAWDISLSLVADKQIYMPENEMLGFIQAGFWDFGDRTQAELEKYGN